MTQPNGHREHVLIVEDDRKSQASLVGILEIAGYRCAVARDAAAGRGLCAQNAFELVLAEINLPNGSGLELLEYVLAESPRGHRDGHLGSTTPRSQTGRSRWGPSATSSSLSPPTRC